MLEHVARYTPRWATGFPQCYNLRERGLTPVSEIAIGMAIVNQTFGRPRSPRHRCRPVAPSMAWVSTADMDLFEEVAKFRALRRVWARRRCATGSARRRPEPAAADRLSHLRPLAAVPAADEQRHPRSVQTLAAILGGVQSVETCTYDEPVSIPTPEARELAILTQQILAHEVGAARTPTRSAAAGTSRR